MAAEKRSNLFHRHAVHPGRTAVPLDSPRCAEHILALQRAFQECDLTSSGAATVPCAVDGLALFRVIGASPPLPEAGPTREGCHLHPSNAARDLPCLVFGLSLLAAGTTGSADSCRGLRIVSSPLVPSPEHPDRRPQVGALTVLPRPPRLLLCLLVARVSLCTANSPKRDSLSSAVRAPRAVSLPAKLPPDTASRRCPCLRLLKGRPPPREDLLLLVNAHTGRTARREAAPQPPPSGRTSNRSS